jgi:glycosyltransferase involved in cell wall biosynthesis
MGITSSRDFVSVVTPFHNTAKYLRECIESVLNQTYGNLEYILFDNASDDGSSEIAREYAARDKRIRLMRTETLLPQVPNYNRALTYISPESRYCKIVQADDWIYPECLDRMVAVAASDPRVGLVSSLRLQGDHVRGDGLSYSQVIVSGREIARFHLMGLGFLFGSPSTVLVRSEIVRGRRPFFEEGRFQEDTEACYEILKEWDFGFVHQVLSYSRVESDSLNTRFTRNDSQPLGSLICTHRYGPLFLAPAEFRERWEVRQRRYYRQLARALIELRGSGYWRFHKNGLRAESLSIDWGHLARGMFWEIFDIVGNPKMTVGRLYRGIRGK